MKTIFLFLSLLLLSTGLHAQRDQFTVGVDGLGCPFCAYGLEANFKEVHGIAKIKIDLEGGILRFEVPTADALTLEAVQDKVTNSGYTARSVEVLRADGQTAQLDIAPAAKKDSDFAAADSNGLVAVQFPVGGSCDMCKERIEATALGVAGVLAAQWDLASQTLQLRLSPGVGSQQAVQHAIAMAGHDTPMAKADKKTYKALPMCCHYR